MKYEEDDLLDYGRITKERYIANKSIKKKTGGPTITNANRLGNRVEAGIFIASRFLRLTMD